MIDFQWHQPDAQPFPADVDSELRTMLAEAAGADVEAGFPQLSGDDQMAEGTIQLLVWLLPDERVRASVPHTRSLAAYLRLEPLRGEDDGVGEVSYVVRPAYRSRGITTLLIEQIGLQLGARGGWNGTGIRSLRVWARGNHPAALRIALRFRRYGIEAAMRRWQLVMPLREGRAIDPGAEPDGLLVREARSQAELAAAAKLWTASGRRLQPPAHTRLLISGPGEAPDGAVWIDPASGEVTEWGTAGRLVAVLTRDTERVHEKDPLVRALLIVSLEHLRDAGIRAGMVTVDAQDRPLVHEARTLGLVHDQTDVQYTVSNTASEPRRAIR